MLLAGWATYAQDDKYIAISKDFIADRYVLPILIQPKGVSIKETHGLTFCYTVSKRAYKDILTFTQTYAAVADSNGGITEYLPEHRFYIKEHKDTVTTMIYYTTTPQTTQEYFKKLITVLKRHSRTRKIRQHIRSEILGAYITE